MTSFSDAQIARRPLYPFLPRHLPIDETAHMLPTSDLDAGGPVGPDKEPMLCVSL